MSLFDDARSVERPRFFDGQQLFASDLDGIVEFHREMRWLHNRSLHQPGIGNGFAVAGRRGDREVRVQAGYALDLLGREIVLLDTHVEPVPPVASESDGGPVFFDLTVSYPEDDDLEEAETRAGVCLPRGVVRLREKPVFCWVRLQRDVLETLRPVSQADATAIQTAMKLVVARAQVRECKLDADITIAIRRHARPPQPPKLACACVPVSWSPWRFVDPPNEVDEPLGLQATVDTSGGAFRVTPCYSARICGIRPLSVISSHDERTVTGIVIDRAAYVSDPQRDGFTCFVAVDALFGNLPYIDLDDLVTLADEHWRVGWLGVQG